MNRTTVVSRIPLLGHIRGWINIPILLIMLMTATLSACGGNASNAGNGELSIALTDAEGDFVSYSVDVVSLSLTRANGTVVQALPVKTRVDFAQYTDMTEFLTIATIPSGVYVKGELVLDYSSAEILVENAAGIPVAVDRDNIKDNDGNPVNLMSMSVKLEGKTHLTILPGIPAHLTLDFDLKASNLVSFAAEIPSIQVKPVLVAEVNLERNRPHRVRGPLKEVQLDAGKFQVYIRPFTHLISASQPHFGVLNVHTNDETVFEIDGQTYQGNTGLEILANMDRFSAVAVLGDVKHLPRRFNAKLVYAGSSVPGGSLDVTRGSVVARSGDVLTVKGITFQRNNGALNFNDTVSVRLEESTTVLKALKLGTFSKNDISVGQFVTIFGTLSTGESGEHQLSAANGYARMEISSLVANRVGLVHIPEDPPAYDFVLDVKRINGRDIAQYDFSGTGIDTANDAKADFYEVDNGPLDVTGIVSEAPVRVRGHVTAFGTAPADFQAMTVISLP